MNKKLLIMAVIIILIVNISGCWDAQDIERMAFPIAAAYDLHGDKQESSELSCAMKNQHFIDVTTLTPNLTPEADSKIRVETETAPTTAFARYQRPLESGQVYQPAMVQVIVIGENLAEVGINPYLDAILRVPLISGTINLAVCTGRGEDILLTRVDDYTNTGVLLQALLRKASGNAFIPATTLHEFAIAQVPGKNPVLPVVEKFDNTGIHINGSAIFKKDKFITWVDLIESRTLMLLRGVKSQGSIPYCLKNDDKEILDTGTVRVKNKRKVNVIRENDSFTFLIKIELNGVLVDHSDRQKLDQSTLDEIEKQVASDIANECTLFTKKMQKELEFDCIDISKYALAKWRKELTPMIDKNFIQDAGIQVDVEVNLENAGELN